MTQTGIPNAYRQELKGRILHVAGQLFHERGIRRVKMDDIAQALTISKRTLYEVYEDKASLLYEVVVKHEEEQQKHLREFIESHEDTMDIIMEFYKINFKQLSDINPLFFEDLQRFPDIIGYLHEQERKRRKRSEEFLERGVEEGYFRKDINFAIFNRLGNNAPKSLFSAKLYKQFPPNEIFRTLTMVFLRGICTQKGIQAIDENLGKRMIVEFNGNIIKDIRGERKSSGRLWLVDKMQVGKHVKNPTAKIDPLETKQVSE